MKQNDLTLSIWTIKYFPLHKFDLTYEELDSIIEDLRYKSKIDLRSFTKSSIKRIVGGYMDSHNLENGDELISLLGKNIDIKKEFKSQLIPDKTEFFRDPGLWRWLKEELPLLVDRNKIVKILELGASSGEEFYSFQILMDQLGIANKINYTATEQYESKLEQLEKGVYSEKNFDTSNMNYERFDVGGDFNEYVSLNNDTYSVHSKFKQNLDLKKFDLNIERAFDEFDIVLCRNVLCYFDRKKSRSVYKTISDFVKKDGYLILGCQEDLSASFYARDFQIINEEFKVFKKL